MVRDIWAPHRIGAIFVTLVSITTYKTKA